MAHAQKPDFVFRRNGRVHLNRRGASVQTTTGSRGLRISGSNVGYTMFRGSVKSTVYPLISSVSPSFPHPCVTVCHHISTGVYQLLYIYSIPPDDGLQICPKHVAVDWRNKLRVYTASSWFLLHRYWYALCLLRYRRLGICYKSQFCVNNSFELHDDINLLQILESMFGGQYRLLTKDNTHFWSIPVHILSIII